MLNLLVSMLVAVATSSLLQSTQAPPETKQFDFWIGKWKCSGESYDQNDKMTKTEATNDVKRVLDGFVVEENFKMGTFVGQSHSVFDPTAKLWRQTWVDNQGSYFALTGTFAQGKMSLTTIPDPAHPKVLQRMTFEKIQKDSFDWNWETSRDSGKTWKLSWHLHYARAK